MEIKPSIIDDIGHVLDVLKANNSAAWKIGAASMLETIAADIRKAVAEAKERGEA